MSTTETEGTTLINRASSGIGAMTNKDIALAFYKTALTAVVHIIDDDESVRAALEGLLRSVGLTPAPHASTSEFLAAKKPDVPGCLVLDVRMPGIGGLDFQEKLCGLGIHLPVILMTGHGDVPMSVRGMKPGAVDCPTKPSRDQDMLDAIATALGRDRMRRDAEAAISGLRE